MPRVVARVSGHNLCQQKYCILCHGVNNAVKCQDKSDSSRN